MNSRDHCEYCFKDNGSLDEVTEDFEATYGISSNINSYIKFVLDKDICTPDIQRDDAKSLVLCEQDPDCLQRDLTHKDEMFLK